MKIAVTGATGCLGMNLCQSLNNHGHEVTAIARNHHLGQILVNQGIHFHSCDLSKSSNLRPLLEDCEVVIHTAALSSHWGKYQDFYQANVTATAHVLKALPAKARLIHVSTPSLYFDFKHRFSITEHQQINTKHFSNHYIKTKHQAEQLVKQAISQDDIDAIILRPRAIFGPFDRALLPQLIHAKGGVPLIGKGENIIDMTYVGNVVQAIELLLSGHEHCLGKTYNITNDQPHSYMYLATQLFHQLNQSLSFNHLSYKKAYFMGCLMEKICALPFVRSQPLLTRYVAGVLHFSQTLSIEAAKKDFNYKPVFSIEQGMSQYVEWLQTEQGQKYG